jgi:hypothetical protein
MRLSVSSLALALVSIGLVSCSVSVLPGPDSNTSSGFSVETGAVSKAENRDTIRKLFDNPFLEPVIPSECEFIYEKGIYADDPD